MLFGNQKNPEPAQFWQDLQEELGEEVVLYTLGELEEMSQIPVGIEVPHEQHRGRPGAVGLCYVTDKAFYFHTFPEKSWFTTLVTSKKNRKEEFRLRIPREEILYAELIKPEGLCKRFFSSPLQRLRIEYSAEARDQFSKGSDPSAGPSGRPSGREGEARASVLLVALHGKGKEFVDSLRQK